MTEREFTLKHIFTDVEKFEQDQYLYSPEKEHFGIGWVIGIRKKDEHLGMYLYTNLPRNQEIHTDYTPRIFSKNREKNHSKSGSHLFKNDGDHWYRSGWNKFIEWRTLEDEYLDDGKLEVEFHVKINNMMTGRVFTLKYIFTDVEKFKQHQYLFSPEEEHFGVEWRIKIKKLDEHLVMYLFTNLPRNQEIHTSYIMRIFSKNREKNHSKSGSGLFKNNGGNWDNWGWDKFIEWRTLEDEYLDGGKLEVEAHVKINKMVGFPEETNEFPRKDLRSFGEDMKQFSDVTLKVKDRKFYISKLYLSSHSPYFETLFLGRFQESEKSEIELKDVDPQDFQYYLEVLHLENRIDDYTVQGILSVADMFDTPKIVKKCEEFLLEKSKKGLKMKLELAGKYRLEELKMTEREFTLKHIFDVEKFKQNQDLFSPEKVRYSPEEEHFGVKWEIRIRKENEHLAMYLCTNVTGNQEIHTNNTLRIFSKNREKNHSKSGSSLFKNDRDNWGWNKFIEWRTLEDEYLDDGKLEVELHVIINKMVGFSEETNEFPRKDLRSFGEDMKQFSDVTLKVKDRKFYISKLYLSSHSPYFATLFLGRFQESEKSEIELKDVNPQDFQYYLEVLHLENAIDDYTVQGILSVADMFDTPKIVKKCEEFLLEKSKKGLKMKLELAGNYRLEELKKQCLDEIKSKADIRSVIPADPSEMDPKILAELLN
ncbi:Protein CBG24449 [Caenorhabditis briggsae]|uniref:Protein CBG24449 n=1 Tax=Caenorhabditis briggsae TaxID=6238 RepID=A8WKQ9_CAEBR|nr:Protein CBG24449 [Caenorhabditis briggsae]CAP21054.1 Protein CBG24449 [Caenorhabditis briggsae]